MAIKTKALFVIFLISFSLAASACFLVKSQKTYASLNRILESGNAAYRDKQYDKAIEFYNAGLRISPKEPALLNNKSAAIRMRAIDLYNSSLRLADKEARDNGMDTAKKDLIEAAALSSEAVNVLKSKSDIETLILVNSETKSHTLESHAESMRLLASIVDRTKADDALLAMHEYIDNEPDPEKKLRAQLAAGQMLIDTLNGQKAFIEYKKILDRDPNDLNAILGAGMALSQSGQKDDLREAKVLLQRFVEQAPQDHSSMKTVKEILDAI